MDETILGAAQTYIGVLATFIVLCLFASKTREGSNFIIYTILMVGEDFKKHLRTYTDEINKEIEESAPKQLEQSDLDNIPKDVATKLNTSSRNIMMITQKFFHNATQISGQFNPDPHFRDKEELPYIALLSLLLIITVMFVDCFKMISLEARCTFVNMLLGTSTMFVLVLYHKFFQDDSSRDEAAHKEIEKPNRKSILVRFFLILAAWFLVAPYICSPTMSVIVLTAIASIGVYIIKMKWIRLCHKNNRYNRFMIIKHYTFFVIYVAIITIVFRHWEVFMEWANYDVRCIDNWNNTVSMVASQSFCYYFILVFFSLNTMFGPLLAGFIYLNSKENEIIDLIESKRKEIQPIIRQYADEYNQIIATIPLPKS